MASSRVLRVDEGADGVSRVRFTRDIVGEDVRAAFASIRNPVGAVTGVLDLGIEGVVRIAGQLLPESPAKSLLLEAGIGDHVRRAFGQLRFGDVHELGGLYRSLEKDWFPKKGFSALAAINLGVFTLNCNAFISPPVDGFESMDVLSAWGVYPHFIQAVSGAASFIGRFQIRLRRITTAAFKARTCFCLPPPIERGNPSHPLCGWSLTQIGMPPCEIALYEQKFIFVKKSGVSIGSFYSYFENKKTLLLEMLED